MFKKKLISLTILCLLLFGGAAFVSAQELIPEPSGDPTPGCKSDNCGDYTLNDFVKLGVNVSNIILGLVGSLSLLMFVYGGISFLISAGNAEAVSKARKIIVAAVLGLAIVFASYIIIQFVLEGLGYKELSTWNRISNT